MSKGTLSLRRPSDVIAGLDQYFNKVFNEIGFGEDFDLSFRGYPRLDVYDDGVSLILEASIPGLTKSDVRVDWQNGELCICGDSVVNKERRMENYIHKELHKSTFCRSLKVDEHKFDIEKIDASVENGLLKVIIPRKDISKFETKQIKIK
jgi:HSP20 family protein